MEVFSKPRVTPVASQVGFSTTFPANFDIATGWDFFNAVDRAKFWEVYRTQLPDVVLMSPECRPFSVLMSANWERMSPEEATKLQTEGMAMLHFCVQIAEEQIKRGKFFFLEQPTGASSWATHAVAWLLEQEGVLRFVFDQCMAGLSLKPDTVSRKTTAIATNHGGIALELSKFQCDGGHKHLQLQSGLPHLAQVYPPQMVEAIVRGLKKTALKGEESLKSFAAEDLDADEVELDREDPERAQASESQVQRITSDQIRLLHKMHNNMGHLPREQMMIVLKAAGCKAHVLEYVRDHFSCEVCGRRKKPIERRKAAFPRTFSFNKILGLDFIYIPFQGKTLAFLNVVCQGTNFQQVGRLKDYVQGAPSGKEAWKLFSELWIRPFGLPEVVLTDGGPEFKAGFERGAEQCGVMQIVSDASSPWQNGRAERHGGWAKDKVEEELQAGVAHVSNEEELELLLSSVVSSKNRYFHRGGYSPAQLVFGCNPRVPLELLGDDELSVVAKEDVMADAFEQDSPAAEFSRAHSIRQRAKELCMKNTVKDRINNSVRGKTHVQTYFSPGQWVYVWRRTPSPAEGHVTRSRWVGPGLLVLQAGHTAWVSMRSRLWKCNVDQLRPASRLEATGAELSRAGELQEVAAQARAGRAGAIDVSQEGSPPEESSSLPSPVLDEARVQVAPDAHLPAIPEEEEIAEVPRASPGMGSLTRGSFPIPSTPAPGTPAPGTPMIQPAFNRRVTEPEPQQEPSRGSSAAPSVSSSTDTSRQRERGNRPPPTELKELERLALRELRRLKKEERATSSTDAPVTMHRSSGSITVSPPSRPRRNQTAETVSEDVNSNEASVEDPPETDAIDDLIYSFGDSEDWLNNLSWFGVSQEATSQSFVVNPVKTKNGEFDMKNASTEEKEGFSLSDQAEFQAILKMGAAKVLKGKEAEQARAKWGHRIITSRMIRRKKPLPGIGNFKFKSRWCVHGHKDPDSETLHTYSPTPSVEAITLFLQIALCFGYTITTSDIKNAFCQSRRLKRPRGPILVRPCEGTGLNSDDLIELVAPVYGLDDAPLLWHETLVEFFEQLGFTRSLLEPCWFVKRDDSGKMIAQVLIEVDDLLISAEDKYQSELRRALEARFEFGKWETGSADFAGRTMVITPEKIQLHQEKYIIEKIIPVRMPKGMVSNKEQSLEPEIFEQFRSLLYKINWVAHQTRPEAAGVVSILSSRLHQAKVHDLVCLNKLASYLRNTAQQSLTLLRFDPKKVVFIAASDAGGVDGKPVADNSEDTVQGAWVVLLSDQLPSASRPCRVSVISWRSAKLKRRVSSTLASEALSFSQSLGEVEWLQVMFRDIVFGDVSRANWQDSLSPFLAVLKEDCVLNEHMSQCNLTDAKSLFDSILRNNPTSRQDRRTSVEIAIIIEAMKKAKSALRWLPHPKMIADALTKDDIAKTNGALESLLRTSRLYLWEEESELERRKKDPKAKYRSRAAAAKLREESAVLLAEVMTNRNLVELSKCFHTFDF